MMMAAFTNMETVHIDAYALLLKTLGMPKTEFEAFRDYRRDARQGRLHAPRSASRPCADVARTLAMFGAFTEGMALFASFAMLLNFPRHNKMNGMGQIVSWSVRDESLHCEGIIKLFHEWNRETGAVTQRGARRHRRRGKDDGEAGGELRRSRLRPRRNRGHATPRKSNAYVRYVADWRLTQLKLPPVFGYFETTESGYKQLKAASAAVAGGNPQRRRARQFLRAARDRIFQGR